MAQIIAKNGHKIVKLIKWREIMAIILQCLFFNCIVLCQAIVLRVESFVKSKLCKGKFSSLNFFCKYNVIDHNKRENVISSPQSLSDTNLGNNKYIKLSQNTKLHYIEKGPSNGEVILLLHGFPDCWFSWRYQIPILSTQYRVIALDMKGFNDSDKPILRYVYRPSIICDELKSFLDALQIKTVHIIGHDLGGLVGWFFAFMYPSYVDKIVQIAAPHPNFYWELSNSALTTRRWCSMMQMPFISERMLINQKNFIEKFHSVIKTNDNAGGTEFNFKYRDESNTYKYIFNNVDDWIGPLNYIRSFMLCRVDKNVSLRSQCVMIIGNQDPNYKLESIVKSGECCTNSSIKIVEGAGHSPHQSHPKRVNHILINTFDIGMETHENFPTEKGLVSRMIQKMYGGQ